MTVKVRHTQQALLGTFILRTNSCPHAFQSIDVYATRLVAIALWLLDMATNPTESWYWASQLRFAVVDISLWQTLFSLGCNRLANGFIPV